jgi:hypothetical protein
LSCLIVGAALLLGATGCQKKANECNQLIEVINKGVDNLNKLSKSADPTSSADFKTMADTMEKLATDASKVELTVPELKKYSGEYQTMVKEAAKAARDLAAAVDAKDPAKMASANTALDKATKAEEPLVEGINKFCQTP